VTERPGTVAALRHDAIAHLAAPDPWIWLAERDGAAIGMIGADAPATAAWIAPMAGKPSVAYTTFMFVAPGARHGGVGGALAAQVHAEADAAGVDVTLLHYATFNPLSPAFWSRQGYRPLWTSWEATPARTMR